MIPGYSAFQRFFGADGAKSGRFMSSPSSAAVPQSLTNAQKLSLPTDTAVGTQVNVTDGPRPGIQTLVVPSTAHGGVFFLSDFTDINGVYSKRGTSGGKNYYNLLGQPDDTNNSVVAWSTNADGLAHAGWKVTNGDGTIEYYSLDNVATPDLVTTWVGVNDALLTNVTSVTALTTGALNAGLKIGSTIYVVINATSGRNAYSDVLGVATELGWNGAQWTDGAANNGTGNTAFPWSAGLGTQDDVANEENWQ